MLHSSVIRPFIWTVALAGLLAVGSMIGLAGNAPGSLDKTFSKEDLREDLRVLWAVLDEGHGGFDRYVLRDVQSMNFAAVEAGLTGPLPEIEFYRRLLPLIAGIKDGHTALLLSAETRAELLARPVLFPFELRFIGDKTHLFRNLSGPGRSVTGAEILAINGTPMTEIRQKLRLLDPGRRRHPVPPPSPPGKSEYLRPEFRRGLRPAGVVRLRLRTGSGRETEATVPGITGSDLGVIRRERYPDTAVRKSAL